MSQKTVFMVGASSGIGYHLALEFASKGWKVYAGSRRVEKMASLKDKGIHVIELDFTNQESVDAARDFILEDNDGKLDLLYLNAGVGSVGSVLDTPIEITQSSFDTNVFGPIRVIQSFQKLLIRNGSTVAFTSSIITHLPVPFMFTYRASKTSFRLLAEAISIECGDLGINVINVMTGAVNTDMSDTPPFIPGANSVYYDGKNRALYDVNHRNMESSVYAKKVVKDVEWSMKKKRVFTEVYRGGTASAAWFLGTFVSFNMLRWIFLKMTKLRQPITVAKERFLKRN